MVTENKRRDERFLVRLSKSEKNALCKYAEAHDVPASQVVRQAVKTVLAEFGKALRAHE